MRTKHTKGVESRELRVDRPASLPQSTINLRPSTSQEGSVLTITMILCGIIGILMGSYLNLVQTQRKSVARSQQWNMALVIAEAGVEEAMAMLNSGVKPPQLWVFPWTGSTITGASKNDTNRPASKFGDSYYQVFVTNGLAGANPVIIAKGCSPGPLGSAALTRTILVNTKPRPTFPVKGPMIVKQSYNANGYNVGTDSFNSTNGPYNPSTAGTNGDVVTLSTNANSVMIGNGKIKGSVHTPPGGIQGVTATIGANGSVGDENWVLNNTGFQTGHFMDDFIMTEFPDATLPNVGVWYTPTSGKAPDGLNYDNLLTSGNYTIADLNGSVYVGQANTVIYVTDSISIGSGGNKKGWAPPQIHIAVGASLTIYMAGATTSIGGNGVVNDTAQAKNFQYYGLPTNTRIDLTGNGAFYGTIYAPQADFNLKGSGNNSTDDFTGSSITKSTTMTGNFQFHYDESLIYLSTLGGYDATSWDEM